MHYKRWWIRQNFCSVDVAVRGFITFMYLYEESICLHKWSHCKAVSPANKKRINSFDLLHFGTRMLAISRRRCLEGEDPSGVFMNFIVRCSCEHNCKTSSVDKEVSGCLRLYKRKCRCLTDRPDDERTLLQLWQHKVSQTFVLWLCVNISMHPACLG